MLLHTVHSVSMATVLFEEVDFFSSPDKPMHPIYVNHSPNDRPMLGHRLRIWPSFDPALEVNGLCLL